MLSTCCSSEAWVGVGWCVGAVAVNAIIAKALEVGEEKKPDGWNVLLIVLFRPSFVTRLLTRSFVVFLYLVVQLAAEQRRHLLFLNRVEQRASGDGGGMSGLVSFFLLCVF